MKVTREVKIGAVVLIGLILLVWGFNYLKGTNIFSSKSIYYAKYEHIDGLAEANPVLVKGVKVGQVYSIEMVDGQDARIKVGFSMNSKSFRIPVDSKARIVSANLMGDKSIEVNLGSSDQFLEPGGTLKGEVEESLSEGISKMMAPLQTKANEMMGSLDSVLTVIQYIFNEGTRESLKESFVRLRNTIKNFEKSSGQLDNMLSDQDGNFTVIMNNLSSITTNIRNNHGALTNAINNFSTISDTLARANISNTITNLNGSLEKLAVIFNKLEKGEGTAGKLLQDEDLYDQLTKASAGLDSLVRDFHRHPRTYLKPFGKRNNPNAP